MPRPTLALLLVLTAISSLLFGVNLGRSTSEESQVLSLQDARPSPTPTMLPSPTAIPTTRPTISRPAARRSPSPSISSTSLTTANGISTFTDKGCGFSFRFPATYTRQQTDNSASQIFTDPEDPQAVIAVVCQETIPKPPVSSEQIEGTLLGGEAATLYHDKNPDGSPRDEIIVRHPTLETDIIIAGWGEAFEQAISTFKFLK